MTTNIQDVVADLEWLASPAAETLTDGTRITEFCKAVHKLDLTQLVKEVEAGAYEEAIKLSDEIEMAEPDGGTRQWMAFKRFRNTLRDYRETLTPPTSD